MPAVRGNSNETVLSVTNQMKLCQPLESNQTVLAVRDHSYEAMPAVGDHTDETV